MSENEASSAPSPSTTTAKPAPSHYVGIGASAGGLEALQNLFSNMPVDIGAAYIIVQHLSPDFKSVMAELLSKSTRMPVYNIVDGVVVEADTVYVIPHRKNMMIAEGKLLLTEQMPEQGLNLPIDIFFRSLAEDQHHRAISIILSGTGSDGSRGIQSIKEVGGLVIVQNPESAKFDGMPHSAVNTGLADLVLAPLDMPDKLRSYVKNPVISGLQTPLIETIEADSSGALKQIFELLKKSSEVDFSMYKPSTVTRRIERRMGINQITSLSEYYQMLLKDNRELMILSKDMLIGVTRFFRDSAPFDVLGKEVIPNILSTAPQGETIRVWVAGCSTGEEAYSIAILLNEAIHARGESRSIKIFATDVDPDAIAEASSGVFRDSSRDDISPERMAAYFTSKNGTLVVTQSIRQCVIFAQHNLIKDPPFSNVHLATCRNTLIYFQQSAQRRVLNSLHFSLVRNGYLFLGASESLGDLQPHFEVFNERGRIFRKTSNLRNLIIRDAPERQAKPDRSPTATAGQVPSLNNIMQNHRGQDRNLAYRHVIDTLLKDYVPPCIILSEAHEILHVYGDVSPYTRKIGEGRFSSNIKDIVDEQLSIALTTALHRSSKNACDVSYREVVIRNHTIDLRIRYLNDNQLNTVFYLVLFEQRTQQDADGKAFAIEFDHNDQSQQRIQDLEQELKKNEENLQVTVEELETTNEELQSSNEELMAANEELQSTNEELQSVNEELYTVNSEYQEKIAELTHVNADIDNLLKVNDIGIVFLDDALLIRSFTPAIAKYVNLLENDIGRPFHHISNQLRYEGMLDDVARVVADEKTIEKEVRTRNNDHLLIRISPYINETGTVRGTVISFTNVTRIHTLTNKLNDSLGELQQLASRGSRSASGPMTALLISSDASRSSRIAEVLDQCAAKGISYETVSSLSDATQAIAQHSPAACLIDGHSFDNEATKKFVAQQIATNSPGGFILLNETIGEEYDQLIEAGFNDCISDEELSPALLVRGIILADNNRKVALFLAKVSAAPNEETSSE